MVIGTSDHGVQADIIFVIEATAVNGAYINDLKTNYVLPTLEYFSQGLLEDSTYLSENANSIYGIVLYQAADCLPHLSSDTLGPFSSATKVVNTIDKLELFGGKGESHANIAEGLATALLCFEELEQSRTDPSANVQKHCILICNSPPYTLPVLETQAYSGKTAEQLAGILQEKNINLSVISPRKIPSLYKLFEKAGGDLNASQTKNYAKDPRHLVLLKGYSLKERPISPPPGNVTSQGSLQSSSLPIASMPSPLAGCDSPSQSTNLLGNNTPGGVGVQPGQSPVYRPPSAGMVQMPQHSTSMVTPGMVGIVNANRGGLIGNQQMATQIPNMQQLNAPPGYHAPDQLGVMGGQRPQARWMMPPQNAPGQQRPYMQPNQQQNPNQGSALIAQLTTPPSSMPNTQVNQFGQMNTNSPLNQQQMKMNLPNQQTSLPQNPSGLQQQTSMSQVAQTNQAITSQAQTSNPQNPQMGPARERPTIWQGLLEWIEKPKNDQSKITKHVPCQVSANSKDGEPELKADGWPSKLIMQLMPKQLIGNIGGAYLKNSKSVLFHPQQCDALESLTKVMSSGFAGCVHFTSNANPAPCDIKVLILLYTAEKRAYLGFIPNDQAAFVDRLRKVIQQQKTSQQNMIRQGAAGPPGMNPQGGPLTIGGTPPQMNQNPVSSQPQQQGLMMSQTNTMAMGGGQITQNVVSSSTQPGPNLGGVLGQNVPGQGMQPRMRMQGIPQQGMGPQQSQMGVPNQGMGQQGMGQPMQQRACENQLQAERQHNLDKINHLKQTLEAAQQQEQQYKSQLERINHMKTTQIQEALNIAQQTEMQFKMMDQQRMQGQQALQNPQQQNQQRMMRPVMSNNPGLRHLLQQQPQYRPPQQLIGIQQMGGNGPRPQMGQPMQQGNTQSTFEDVSNFDFM